MPLIDALKALASQLIVLHHFSAYGPLADALDDVLPLLSSWLYDYGRMAVQVFLVVGGFLAVRSLAPQGQAAFAQLLALLWQRYRRLVRPFTIAMLIAVACAALARAWLDDHAVPGPATLLQFLAHAALLQGVLHAEALSVGVWYVAIDFQLFALLAVLLWFAQRVSGRHAARVSAGLVGALAIASLFHFNRDAAWDDWALYFFGAYALGVTTWWAAEPGRRARWMVLVWGIGLLALATDFRLRIALALAVAMLLGIARRSGLLERWPDVRPVAFLARISYAVFLVHFPVYLLVNACFERFGSGGPAVSLLAVAIGWAASIAAGTAFHHGVELRDAGATQRLRTTMPTSAAMPTCCEPSRSSAS
jgi:peptidoglycan/LPS O-acetylase OafA/YrhL